VRRIALAVLLTGSLSGCGDSAGTASNSVTSPRSASKPTLPTTATAAGLVFCVQETNRYRAMVGVRSVIESAALEAYAADGARIEGSAHAGHLHFTNTNGGGAFAENEIPWWPLAFYGSVQEVMRQGIALFWSEGPSGGHYRNLVNATYSQGGCGVFIQNGEITVVQDLR
jgi:hypothetical protein